MSDLTHEQAAEIGREIADELGLPNGAAELGSFYLGLGLGSALGRVLADNPGLPPAEVKELAREVLSRGAFQMIQTLRAHVSEADPDGPTH